jgi:hypothetical protein
MDITQFFSENLQAAPPLRTDIMTRGADYTPQEGKDKGQGASASDTDVNKQTRALIDYLHADYYIS